MSTIQGTSWLSELKGLLKPDQISTGSSVLEQHSRGESFDEFVLPEAVVFPESAQDVQKVMRFAYERAVPVTPVAINSSLEGHTVPLHGGVSLDMTRMNRILAFEPENLLVVTQPAVTYPQINTHTGRSGLFFPVDPGAHASIGGMLMTNASGTMAVRYGVTGDFVLGLEIVTPTGEIIRTGSRARKSASGYNLTRLYCGSEGTLGVVTEVTLRLVGLPEAASAARVPFADTEAATQFVTSLIGAGLPIARCELVDAPSIAAVNAHQGTDYPEELTIFLEFHGNPQGVAADAELAKDIAEAHGALAFESSSDPAERAKLWEARHNMYYAAVAANPGKRNITTDVTVPIGALPEALRRARATFGDLNVYTVGHVGDGNFHLVTFFDESEAAAAQVESLSHQLVLDALELGGTSTGEHGVGIRKLKYMDQEHGAALHVMRAVKSALDPKGIMNPGKKLPRIES